jgi:hypothetical protein
MTKFIGALLMVLSLSLFGSAAVSALDTAPAKVAADQGGDKDKKKQGKKGKKGKKKNGKKGKKGKGKKGSKKQDKKKKKKDQK